ncbi:DUF4365 domain-containing protein, partial [Aeromicrobium sp.]
LHCDWSSDVCSSDLRAEALQIPRQKRGDRVGSGKQVSRSAHIGDAGIALIHQRVSAMDHVWHERTVDAGIDGTIELRDPATGEVSNCHLQVQSKARDNDFRRLGQLVLDGLHLPDETVGFP